MSDTSAIHASATVTWGTHDRAIIQPRFRREAERVPRSFRLERLAVFCLPLAIYLTIGALISFKYHVWFGDAQARLANAYYVLYSRDPHLAAVGFVWNPGLSIAELPVLLLKPIWPGLSADTFGATIVSSLAMAGAGYQLYRFFEELRIGRAGRWALLAAFVANPMILYYGGDGMSEALFMFFLVGCARYLAKWLREPSLRPLVISALYLGLAYMVRNEAVAAAGFGALAVLVFSYRRAPGVAHARRMTALTDLALFVIPFLLAFVGWALTSWIIVGHPFEQYSSAYGTAAQLKLLGATHTDKITHFWWAVRGVFLEVPVLPVLIYLGIRTAWRHRDVTIVSVLAILGAVVLFEVLAYTAGQIIWALRYVIYAVPFTVMLAACFIQPDSLSSARRSPDNSDWTLVTSRHTYGVRNIVAGIVGVSMIVVCIFATEHTMLYTGFDLPDQQALNYVLWPASTAAKANPARGNWKSVQAEAASLDAMHLGHGAIMVDNFEPCIPNLILQSKRPKEFAIPNDEDFIEKMGAPYESGVRYFIVSNPVGYGLADALNKEWPTLYEDGAQIATLAGTIKMSDCPPFRLYKLIPSNA